MKDWFFANNNGAYFLLVFGVVVMVIGHQINFDALVRCGDGITGAGLLAWQKEHAPVVQQQGGQMDVTLSPTQPKETQA